MPGRPLLKSLHLIVLLFSIALSISAQPQRVKEWSPREIARRVFPSVVLIVTYDVNGKPSSLGSGFFVKNGVVATNYHVISGAKDIRVKRVNQKGIYKVIRVIQADKDRDLALLKIENATAPVLALGDSQRIGVGEEIYVAGNPEGLEGTFSQGIVSARRGRDYIQISAPISHGSSGGPVLNKASEVIGVAVGTVEAGQNLNFAIPIEYLKQLMMRNEVPPIDIAPEAKAQESEVESSEWRRITIRLESNRVTLTSDKELDDYSAYKGRDRFILVLPNTRTRGRMPMLNTPEDKRPMHVMRRGIDLILTFPLQEGETARVNQRFNRLDIQFSR
jgi:hypothetical protein